MSDESSLLRVDALDVVIGDQQILQSLNFTLGQGGTLGIVGESGSGKSMTALAMMRLLPRGAIVHGSIHLGAQELNALPETRMQAMRGSDIAMVFQEPMTALNPVHTVGAQIAESLRLHRDLSRRAAHSEARAAMDRVGLEAISVDRYPHELSGGQRQRVVIAIAIACRPRLLIADEPTTALDVTTQADILSLLSNLQQQTGMALILISHDLAVVADTVDELLVMRDGRIVDAGAVRTIFSASASDYTQQLMRASSWSPPPVPQQTLQEPLLEVSALSASYPGSRRGWFGPRERHQAVDEVSFAINAGENVGLVGESGSGKSTLARCLLGLMPVDGGQMRLRGEPVALWERSAGKDRTALAASVRRQIQIVFQDPYGSFNPRHRVERLVAEPLHLLQDSLSRAQKKSRVSAMLERVGMDPVQSLRRYPHEFSGGQRQRIAIARALIVQPSLVILDEAVSALDVSVRAQVLALLAELAADEGLAYLFVSHDLSVVRNVTDRVLIFQDGSIVEQGPTSQVLTRPRHAYTQSLVDAIPVLPAHG